MTPQPSLGSYPNLRISGRATFPMAAAAATEEPLTAPKAAQAPIVAIPSPPGSLRAHLSKVL